MSDAEHDPIIRRAVDDLRRLPPLDAARVRRVVDAAAVARVSPSDDELMLGDRRRPARVWTFALVAAAAAFVGFALRGAWSGRHQLPAATVATAAATTAEPAAPAAAMRSAAMPAGAAGDDGQPVPHQFVFENGRARRVALVGDFNGWNAANAPMARSPGGASWSVIVRVPPGRHLYGFMVDDSVFTLDPRQPKARDADLGGEGSVVIVGRP